MLLSCGPADSVTIAGPAAESVAMETIAEPSNDEQSSQ